MTPPKDATAGEALKPCPFCGGAAVVNKAGRGDGFVASCLTAPCMGAIFVPSNFWGTRAKAAEAWNRRPSADPAAVEAARRAALEEAAKVADAQAAAADNLADRQREPSQHADTDLAMRARSVASQCRAVARAIRALASTSLEAGETGG